MKKNKTFEEKFNKLLIKDETHHADIKRKSFFYIIAGVDELYENVDRIYDFDSREIKPECLGPTDEEVEKNRAIEYEKRRCVRCCIPLEFPRPKGSDSHECDRCYKLIPLNLSERQLITLAFNLYNGEPADVKKVFSNLDEPHFNIAMNAVRLRFNNKNFISHEDISFYALKGCRSEIKKYEALVETSNQMISELGREYRPSMIEDTLYEEHKKVINGLEYHRKQFNKILKSIEMFK